MTAELQIRRYRPEDHDRLWAIHNRALQSVSAHAGNGDWDDDLHHVSEVYLRNKGEFYVGELEGRIVAMGGLKRISDDTAEVKRMRVDPPHQGAGYGKTILRALELRARELGYRTLTLETTQRQRAARHIYAAAGYIEQSRRQMGEFTIIRMTKTLPDSKDDSLSAVSGRQHM